MTFIIFLISIGTAKGQTAQFSQYYASPLYLNPAMAGAIPDITFNSIYRSQWHSIVTPYTTTQGSLILPLYSNGLTSRNHWGGIGLSVFNDRAGAGNLNNSGISATLAYNVPLDQDRFSILSFGLQGGMVQKRVDINEGWGSQFNPFLGLDPNMPVDPSLVTSTALFPDIASGLLYQFNPGRDFDTHRMVFYAGLSAYHLNSPNESLIRTQRSVLPRLFRFHTGTEFRIAPRITLSPNILAVYQNNAYQINGGMYLTFRVFDERGGVLGSSDIIFGTWYRLNDAVIGLLGFNHKNYTIGFSYDLNSSSLYYFTRGRGAYEVSLSIKFPRSPNKEIKSYSTPRI
ncbi:MAG: PorP/SprF family type IX secretion system membrane protein [Cytophagaceae bacterium]